MNETQLDKLFNELVHKIKERAKTGVYRYELLDQLSDYYSSKQVKLAINKAKDEGMYSVPSMNLGHGTFYQID